MRVQKKLQVPNEEFAKVWSPPDTKTKLLCLLRLHSFPVFYIIFSSYVFPYFFFFVRIQVNWTIIQILPIIPNICLWFILFHLLPNYPVEVCVFIAGSSRVSSGLWCCVYSFSGSISIIFKFCTCHFSWDIAALFDIDLLLCFCREGMYMVLGNSILDWNILTMPQSGHMQQIRYYISR